MYYKAAASENSDRYMWADLQKGVTSRKTTFWDIEQYSSKINEFGFSIFLHINNL